MLLPGIVLAVVTLWLFGGHSSTSFLPCTVICGLLQVSSTLPSVSRRYFPLGSAFGVALSFALFVGLSAGGTGKSLVKGVVMTLSAVGLSIKPGDSARIIDIRGGLKTLGSGAPSIEHHGAIEALCIAGGGVAAGGGFDNI